MEHNINSLFSSLYSTVYPYDYCDIIYHHIFLFFLLKITTTAEDAPALTADLDTGFTCDNIPVSTVVSTLSKLCLYAHITRIL